MVKLKRKIKCVTSAFVSFPLTTCVAAIGSSVFSSAFVSRPLVTDVTAMGTSPVSPLTGGTTPTFS